VPFGGFRKQRQHIITHKRNQQNNLLHTHPMIRILSFALFNNKHNISHVSKIVRTISNKCQCHIKVPKCVEIPEIGKLRCTTCSRIFNLNSKSVKHNNHDDPILNDFWFHYYLMNHHHHSIHNQSIYIPTNSQPPSSTPDSSCSEDDLDSSSSFSDDLDLGSSFSDD
jgi:hypothetical protein